MQFEKTGVQPETIQGIGEEDRSIGSAYLLSLSSYEQNYVDQAESLVAVRKASDASAGDTRATIERVLLCRAAGVAPLRGDSATRSEPIRGCYLMAMMRS